MIMNYHSSSETVISELRSEESVRNRTLFYQADVTSVLQVKEMFLAAESHFDQPVTTVVNNAMVGGFKFNGDARPKIHQLSWSHLDGQLQGFLRGALHTTQAALPGFEKAGFGRLINWHELALKPSRALSRLRGGERVTARIHTYLCS